ncbi:hypothetical protein FGW37_32665 [Streptomyces rectiverticillatus]|uniref:DUF6585 family protein n=1 Tax=Streptomyces rectiverticillatus TaxID=173860 RepID=UPI0015C2E04B|nr:DUF6585 family protein [Streptomyces rectiverticillatus]QLE75710.1 hypothetical protein FGW37_32665 [Streptomyces rectiverticillatus]
MDEQIPEPDGRVTALAERERLGRWRMVAANRQNRLRRSWGEARLYLYDEGLIVTDPENGEWVYRWESTSVLQNLSTINGAIRDAAYTLVGPDGAALTVGRGIHGLFKRDLAAVGVTSHTRGPWIVFEGQWGPEIQQGVLRTQLATSLERLARGERLTFGRISLDRNSVSYKRKTADWAQVGGVSISNAAVWFNNAGGRSLMTGVSVSQVPNLYLLLALAERLRG